MKKNVQKKEEILSLAKNKLPELLLDYICDNEGNGLAAQVRQAYNEVDSLENLIAAGQEPYGIKFEENNCFTNFFWVIKLTVPLWVLVNMADLKVCLWDGHGRYTLLQVSETIAINGKPCQYCLKGLLQS